MDAPALSGDGQVLAGESAADDVDGREVVPSDFPHVPVSLDFGPVFFEDFGCIWVAFALPDGFDFRPFEAKVNPANTREEGPVRNHHSP